MSIEVRLFIFGIVVVLGAFWLIRSWMSLHRLYYPEKYMKEENEDQ